MKAIHSDLFKPRTFTLDKRKKMMNLLEIDHRKEKKDGKKTHTERTHAHVDAIKRISMLANTQSHTHRME